ncbi:RHS repeat domain-containing protein [Glaciecola siphonariae]|uniref:RHS repeat domain-containing protein n=1 Tax=Glaciecola siphonariae TaxID=521012 RepID=A0ABV9LXJ5_9ALTE
MSEKRSQFYRSPANNQSFVERYVYDGLNRLESRTLTSHLGTLPTPFKQRFDFEYDLAGNIRYKSDKGYYQYQSDNPNVLLSVHSNSAFSDANRLLEFSYDDNGNVKADGERIFTYSAFDKPTRIQKNKHLVQMRYGIERQLLNKRHERMVDNERVITDHTYIGNYEKIVQSTGEQHTEHKYHLANGKVVYTKRQSAANDYSREFHYLHKDTQGSVVMISDTNANIVKQSLYTPFGEHMSLHSDSLLSGVVYQAPTEAGYTGHHMMDSVNIIHMGGRIYDPTLGRFMQADPFVQAPKNTQTYNRYSYVLNNPMSYTDPSGFFFKKSLSMTKSSSFYGLLNVYTPITSLYPLCKASQLDWAK